MEEQMISVIDLGTTKIVGLVGEKTPNGYRVIASSEVPSQGVMRGEVVNNQSVLNALRPLLKDLEEKTGHPITDVVVGIAGQHIRCQAASSSKTRSNKLMEISAQEIDEMRNNMFDSRVNPGEEILHVIPQSYHVDEYMNINPVGMFGTSVEANYRLFIGKTVSTEHTKRCIESADLHLSQLILEPLASALAVLKEDEKELGVAMVDIGGGTTDLLVYQNNIIRHTAVIPFGGNVITEDIRQGCEVTQRQAEQMKIQYGSCYADLAPENKAIVIPGIGGREPREVPFKLLSHIIEARMDEIMDAVVYEIKQSGYAGKIPAGIVLTGGGAKLGDLMQFIKYKTGYDTRIACPAHVELNLDADADPVKYACAVGLLMKGFEKEDVTEPQREPELVDVFNLPKIPQTENSKASRKASNGSDAKVKAPKPPKPEKDSGFTGGLFDQISRFFNTTDNKA